MKNEKEEIIGLLLEQTEKLLRDHWADVESFRNGDSKIKVTLAHHLRWRGSERLIKTAVSFGRRFRETAEESFDLDQLELTEEPVGRGRRPKT
jgi:hypothetical protein